MGQGSITIHARGEATTKLLACLRQKADPYGVGIDEPDGNRVHVSNSSGSVEDLQAFLDQHLDQCAEELGISNRERHLQTDPQHAT